MLNCRFYFAFFEYSLFRNPIIHHPPIHLRHHHLLRLTSSNDSIEIQPPCTRISNQGGSWCTTQQQHEQLSQHIDYQAQLQSVAVKSALNTFKISTGTMSQVVSLVDIWDAMTEYYHWWDKMVGEQSCEMPKPIKLSMCNYFPKWSVFESNILSSSGLQKIQVLLQVSFCIIFKLFIHAWIFERN